MSKRLVTLLLAAVALFLAYCLFSIKIGIQASKKESGADTMFITDVYNYVAVDELNRDGNSHPLPEEDTLQRISSVKITPPTQSSSNSMQQSLIENITSSPSIYILRNRQQMNVWNSSCSHQLCTQYLSAMDLTKFRVCTRHLNRHNGPIANGTCRFINGTTHRKVALYSFPGSGNTWVRGLLEKATGICTGAVYCDTSLRVAGFNGEGLSSSAVLAVKTHESIKSFQAVIHVVRCPGDAIVSEWNRKHGNNSASGKHTAHASTQVFGDNKEWDLFIHEWSDRWRNGVLKIAKYQQKQQPLLRVFYEDLKYNATHEIIRMLNFLNVPYSVTHLKLRLNSGYQKFHRLREHTLTPFTQQQRVILREMMLHLIKDLSEKGYQSSKDYVQKYLSCA